MKFSHVLIYCLLIAFISSSCHRSSERFSDDEVEEITNDIKILSDSLTSNPDLLDQFLKDHELKRELKDPFAQFYSSRDHELAWISLDALLPQANELLEQMGRAGEHGLDSAVYGIKDLKEMSRQLFTGEPKEGNHLAEQYLRLDYDFTAAYFTYAAHMFTGILNPEKADSNWYAYPKKKEWAVYLNKALENGKVAESIAGLAPKHPQYQLLQEKLAEYRELAAEGEYPNALPSDIAVQPGDSAKVISSIKAILSYWGDLSSSEVDSTNLAQYDEALEKAIKSFQERHGIENDGRLGPETIAVMNIPIKQRIEQIRLNMERLRWLPEDLGDHFILVNIPDYQLKVLKEGEVELDMKVIVGKIMNATPIFSDTMEYLVFSPTWTVPQSISVKEMLPKIKEDDNYFEEKNLVLYESWDPEAKEIDPKDIKWKKIDEEDFNFKIVENPGDRNALGSVKFMFPNSEAIYLHDTPTGHLFDRTERGFSHGCIRIERPSELAAYLLQDNDEDWDVEKITEYMALDTPTIVPLEHKLPVHIVYHSAWVDEDDRIHFRKDIYSHDKTQEQAIERKEEALM